MPPFEGNISKDSANEYMTVQGLRAFEKFAATFLFLMAEEPTPTRKDSHG